MLDIHAQFVRDYNAQKHWARRDRDDWLLFVRLPTYAPRKRRVPVPVAQLILPEMIDTRTRADEAS